MPSSIGPGSLIYSPSGSEGGRSHIEVAADLDKSLAGVALITTPGTTPLASRKSREIENNATLVDDQVPFTKVTI